MRSKNILISLEKKINALSEMVLDNRRMLKELTNVFNEPFTLDDNETIMEHEHVVEMFFQKMKELNKFHDEIRKYNNKLTSGEVGES